VFSGILADNVNENSGIGGFSLSSEIENSNIVKANRSFKWTTLSEAFIKVASPIMNIVLAHFLAPSIFGIVASLNIIVSFGEMISEAGFSRYIVQKEENDEDFKNDVGTANVATIAVSLLTFILIAIFNAPFATFVGAEGYGVFLIIASIQLPLYGFSSIEIALERRFFRFKRLSAVRIVASLSQITLSVLLAVFGKGIESVIFGSICSAAIQAVMLTLFERKNLTFRFNRASFKRMWVYSSLYFAETFLTWLNGSIDTFFLNSFFDKNLTGIFKNAFSTERGIMMLVTAIYSSILISLLSRMQNNKDDFAKTLSIYQRVISFIVIPMGAGIFIYRDFFQSVFFGDGWEGAGLVMGAFALSDAIRFSIGDFVMSGITAKGKPQYNVFINVVSTIWIIVSFFGFARFGFTTFVIVRASYVFLHIALCLAFCQKILSIKPWRFLLNVLPATFVSIMMCALAIAQQSLKNSAAFNAIGIALCIIFYFFLCYIFYKDDIKNLFSIILGKNLIINSTNSQAQNEKPLSDYEKKTNNTQIDGLCGVVCICVVFFHYCFTYSHIFYGTTTSQFAIDELVLTSAFFILSGLFASYSNIHDFWKEKRRTLYFPYLISISLISIIESIYSKTLFVNEADMSMNLLAIPMVSGRFRAIDGTHWYIQYLLYFFVLFSISEFIASKAKKPFINSLLMIALTILISARIVIPEFDQLPFKILRAVIPPNLIFIMIGFFLSNAIKQENKKENVVSILFLVYSFVFGSIYIVRSSGRTSFAYFVLFFAIIILSCLKKVPFLSSKILLCFGKSSIFIYLIHQNLGYLIITAISKNNQQFYPVGVIAALVFSLCFGIILTKAFNVASKKIQCLVAENDHYSKPETRSENHA